MTTTTWWWRIPFVLRSGVILAALTISALQTMNVAKVSSTFLLVMALLSVYISITACRARLGAFGLYAILSISGASYWAGGDGLPMWLAWAGGCMLMAYGLRTEEVLAHLVRIPVIGRPAGYALVGLTIGVSLFAGYSAIIDAYLMSAFGERYRNRLRAEGKRLQRLVLGLKERAVGFGFRIESLVLVIAEYVTETGRGIVQASRISLDSACQASNKGWLRLHEVYSLDWFSPFYVRHLSSDGICSEWQEAVKSYVTPGSRVLEIGAGTGLLSCLVTDLGGEYFGIEQCQELITFAEPNLRDRIMHGAFPAVSINGAYDVIIMHRNVMLELINAFPVEEVLRGLNEVVSERGVVLFDYPMELSLPSVGNYINLVHAYDDKSNHTVVYGYVPLSNSPNNLSTLIELKWIQDQVTVRKTKARIDFSIPPLSDVKDQLKEHGFSEIEIKGCGMKTVYPGAMAIVMCHSGGGDV